MRNLLRRLLARNRGLLIGCAMIVGGFQFIICAILVGLDLETTLEQVMAFAPPIFRAMIEQTMPGGSGESLLAFGWNHPITQAAVSAIAITFGARAVAGEVESGAIELVLAQPLSRASYLLGHIMFGVGAITLVVGAGALGMVAGQRVFGVEAFNAGSIAQLVVNLFLLVAALHALTLLVSVYGREMGRVAVVGVLFALVSYLVNIISTLWSKAQFARPFSLHSYYDPRAILVDANLPIKSVLVLSLFAAVCYGAAARAFATRDLP